MTRKRFLGNLLGLAATPLVGRLEATELESVDDPQVPKLNKSKAEWRKLLAPAAYLKTRRLWKCRSQLRKAVFGQSGTIFEDSPIGLSKCFPPCGCL